MEESWYLPLSARCVFASVLVFGASDTRRHIHSNIQDKLLSSILCSTFPICKRESPSERNQLYTMAKPVECGTFSHADHDVPSALMGHPWWKVPEKAKKSVNATMAA
jgi:hypothetical protein